MALSGKSDVFLFQTSLTGLHRVWTICLSASRCSQHSKWVSKRKPVFLHLLGSVLTSEGLRLSCNKGKTYSELIGRLWLIRTAISPLRFLIGIHDLDYYDIKRIVLMFVLRFLHESHLASLWTSDSNITSLHHFFWWLNYQEKGNPRTLVLIVLN